jgi:DNA adenine methylase
VIGCVNFVEPFTGSAAVWLACPGWGEPMSAPFPYFGGKSRAAALVWSRFGPALPKVATLNDINAYIANFWRSTAFDPEAVARWASWPVNETDLHSRHRWLLGIAKILRARLEADPMNYDARIAGWWAWGASAWIGSGWCEEGREPVLQAPHLAGGQTKTDPATNYGKGIHAAGMRSPSVRLPDLGGGTQWGTDEANARAGKGVHREAMRGPSQQLPDLGAGVGNYGYGQIGRGTHAATTRTRLFDIFAELSRRLRYTRVACGDFERILTPSVTYRHGLTAVFLDPEYLGFEYVYGKKGTTEQEHCAIRAVKWAREVGQRDDLRIALCGYDGNYDMPGWECVPWRAKGGYSNQGSGENENAKRERIWFSPACLKPGKTAPGQLDIFARPA